MRMRNYRVETCCIILVFLALNAGAAFESIETVVETANQQDAKVHIHQRQEHRRQQQEEDDGKDADNNTCGSGSVATAAASNSSEFRKLGKNYGQGGCMDVVKEECDALVGRYGGSREAACIDSFSYMQTACRKTCLLCANVDKKKHTVSNIYSEHPQNVYTPPSQDDDNNIMDLVAKVDDYMYNHVYNQDDPKYKVWQEIKYDCKNQHADCMTWARMGECDKNPTYMKMNCGPSCFTCDLLDFNTRCPYDAHAPQTLTNSDELDAMFTRMVTQAHLQQNYTITILSQPTPPTTTTSMKEEGDGSNDNTIDKSQEGGPWVVLLDDFLTDEECDTLIALGTERGYERSQGVSGLKRDGSIKSHVSKGRTSSNTCACRRFGGDLTNGLVGSVVFLMLRFCPLFFFLFFFFSTTCVCSTSISIISTGCTEACMEHNVSTSVHNRIQDLLQIPPENYEYLQLLKCKRHE